MKTNKLWLGILIGVLASAIIGLSVFVVYDRLFIKDDDINTDQNNSADISENNDNISTDQKENPDIDSSSNQENYNTVTELSVDSDLVKSLYQLSGGEVRTSLLGLYNSPKLLLKDLAIDYQENLLYIQLLNHSSDRKFIQNEQEYFEWYGSTVKAIWVKIFGSSTIFSLSGQTVNGVTYQGDGSLTVSATSGRFEGPYILSTQITKATQSKDEIALYEAVKFIDFETGKYYSDVEKTRLTTETAVIPANYKKLFKKDIDGNYYFYSIEKIISQ